MPNLHHTVLTRLLRTLAVAILLATAGHNPARAQDVTDPAAIGEAVTAGPWSMTVDEVLLGDDAGAEERNVPPPDGLRFVAVQVTVQNQSSGSLTISVADFAVIDSSGIPRRTIAAFPPEPALEGAVASGEGLTGWLLGSASAGDDNLVLFYDSATISGDWADHAFALTDGAALDPSEERAAELNRDGRTPETAVGIDTVLSTRDWTVRIVDIVAGPAVVDISPAGTQRLAQSYMAGDIADCLDTWIAFNIEVTNNGGDGQTRYLSATAFQLAYADGSPVEDVRTLSPPAPELTGAYLAGATRTGWFSVELPANCDPGIVDFFYDGNLLRFQPSVSAEDVRYLTWGDGALVAPPETPQPQPFDPNAVIPAGTIAVTIDVGVRIREEPSTGAEVVVELVDAGAEVEITGEPEQADGYVWYPVEVVETGEEGWTVQDFIEAT